MYDVYEPPSISDGTQINAEPYFFYLVPLVFVALAVTANVALNISLNVQTSSNYNLLA
ncbi:hypothetical protein KI126_000005 [Enterococcus faecium]|nr:hypothetical protein [Enterococcus faecium]